jgi:hypothetical protein
MLTNLIIAPDIREKILDKHNVKEDEVKECFLNHDGTYVEDDDEPSGLSGRPTEGGC